MRDKCPHQLPRTPAPACAADRQRPRFFARCIHAFARLPQPGGLGRLTHGNALTSEEWEHWYTPAHVIGGWGARLREREAIQATRDLLAAPGAVAAPTPAGESVLTEAVAPVLRRPALSKAARQAAATGQMTLF